MPKSSRFALRSLAIVAVVLIGSLAFLHHSAKSGAQAAGVDYQGDLSPVSTCANIACNTSCWADGTHPNTGTFVHKTPFSPPECNGQPGCATDPCPCANTACNSSCWADGTHTNSGTVAVHTTNHGCTGGAGKCETQSCF